jgi:hypothetical protein
MVTRGELVQLPGEPPRYVTPGLYRIWYEPWPPAIAPEPNAGA